MDGGILLFGFGVLASASLVLFAVSRNAPRPADAPDAYRTALHQILQDDPTAALESLRRMIESGKAPPDAYIQMGNLLRGRGETVAAFQVHQSLTVRSDLGPAERLANTRALVEDYRALGQRDEALRTLRGLVELRRDAPTWAELAREALQAGQADEAWSALREAARLDPGIGKTERAAFLAALAERSVQRGAPDDAKRWLQIALKEDDTSPPALLGMGEVAAQEGDLESALYYWQKLVFAGPAPGADVHEKLERAYFELGKFGEVERVYGQVLEKRPRDVATLLAAARIALKKGDVGEAERLARAAVDADPRSPAAFQILAGVYLDEARTRELRELIAGFAGRLQAQPAAACTRPNCPQTAGRVAGYCVECGRFGVPAPAA